MKEMLKLLALIMGFSLSLKAGEEDQNIPVVLEYILPLGKKDTTVLLNKTYPRSALIRFTTLEQLLDDTRDNEDAEPLPIPLRNTLPSHFDLLIDLINSTTSDIPNSIAQDGEQLINLFMLANLLDPKPDANNHVTTLYPLTMALLNHIGTFESSPKDKKLKDLFKDANLILMLLDNFSELIENENYNQNPNAIREALRIILRTNYLKISLSNNNARLIIDGIKKRAIAYSTYPKLIQRVQYYIFNNSESESLFPIVPDHITKIPTLGFFPLSVQDIKNANLMPQISNHVLHLTKQGLTDLNGISSFATLQTLSLYQNNLTTLQPGTFTGLTALQTLYLAHNNLTTLQPGTFTGLTALQKLSLFQNNLTTLQPGTFTGLTALQILYLSQNNLTNLQPGTFTGLTALRTLDLSQNNLTTLQPGTFTGLTTLQILDLHKNNLATLQPRTFTGLTALQELDLHQNNLTTLQPGTFIGLTILQRLDLFRNNLTTLQPRTFTGLTMLEYLYLSNNNLTTLQPGTFTGLTALRTLSLSKNNLITLPKGIFANLPTLKVLLLFGNQIPQTADQIHQENNLLANCEIFIY